MKTLSAEEVNQYLVTHLQKWSFDGQVIKREFKFINFIQAFSFMTSIAFEAEKMDHHPAWNNVYNTVSITLSTHDPLGITTLDLDLAGKIDDLFKKND